MKDQLTMSPFDWSLLFLLSLLWGGSFFFAEIALRSFSPFTIVFARVLMASITLFLFLRARGKKIPGNLSIWAAFAGMGLLNNLIPFSLLFYGQTQIGAGLASILNAMTPVFTVIVAHFLTSDERMTPNKIAGVGAGFVGVSMLIGAEALDGMSLTVLAMIGCLGAALSYAFAAIYGRRFKRMEIEPTTVAFGQVTATAIMTAPIMALVDTPWHAGAPGVDAVVALIALGLLSTAFAYYLFFRLLASGGATNLTLVTFLIPVSSVFLGVTFLGEHLSTNHFAGMGLIALGLAAIDGRVWRRLTGKAAKIN